MAVKVDTQKMDTQPEKWQDCGRGPGQTPQLNTLKTLALERQVQEVNQGSGKKRKGQVRCQNAFRDEAMNMKKMQGNKWKEPGM